MEGYTPPLMTEKYTNESKKKRKRKRKLEIYLIMIDKENQKVKKDRFYHQQSERLME